MAVAGSSEARTPVLGLRRGTRTAAAAVVLVALALSGGWVLTRPDTRPSARVAGSTGTTGPAAARGATGTRVLEDASAGYRVAYPTTWTEVASVPKPLRSLHGHVIRITGRDAFSIETFPLQRAVSAGNLADMRAVTDAILSIPRAQLTVLDVRQVQVAHLPAIYYLYYFPAGGRTGIHAQYFIFDGARMYAVVFQVVPASHFAAYASRFDKVVASFQTLAP